MKHLLDVTPPGGRPYPVLYGRDPATALVAVWQARWRQAAIIGDDTTIELFAKPIAEALRGRGCAVIELAFPPGEESKTRATKEWLENELLHAGFGRHGCIVALGGGIALDVAGYVAATFMRGVAHVNVATTLLAQVDAAIGGKTGVNTPLGKNLIGAFHHPRAVLIDLEALESQGEVDLKNGLAEAVKHAVLRDEKLFARLEEWAAGSGPIPDDVIVRSIAIKAEVVAEDDRDSGLRNILNFGHTAAHAIETATDHATPHGYAVATGMVIEARLAQGAGWLDAGELERLIALLDRIGLPVAAPCPFDAALPFFAYDKKSDRGTIECAIPHKIGHIRAYDGRWTRAVTAEQMRGAW